MTTRSATVMAGICGASAGPRVVPRQRQGLWEAAVCPAPWPCVTPRCRTGALVLPRGRFAALVAGVRGPRRGGWDRISRRS